MIVIDNFISYQKIIILINYKFLERIIKEVIFRKSESKMITYYKIANLIVQIKHNNDELFRHVHDELKYYKSKELQIGDILIEINAGNDDFSIPKKAIIKSGTKMVHNSKDYILKFNEALIVADFKNKRIKVNYMIVNPEVLNLLKWTIKRLIINTAEESGFIYIHGAALRYKGKNIIFSGDSCSGKSSCLLRLYRAGAKLISDDNILVKDMQLIPFCLKTTINQDLAERFNIENINLKFDARDNLMKENTKGADILIFPKIWNHKLSEIISVTKAEAVEELKKIYFREIRIMDLPALNKDILFKNYKKIIEKTKCFTLYAGNDEKEVKRTLLQFLDNLE